MEAVKNKLTTLGGRAYDAFMKARTTLKNPPENLTFLDKMLMKQAVKHVCGDQVHNLENPMKKGNYATEPQTVPLGDVNFKVWKETNKSGSTIDYEVGNPTRQISGSVFIETMEGQRSWQEISKLIVKDVKAGWSGLREEIEKDNARIPQKEPKNL